MPTCVLTAAAACLDLLRPGGVNASLNLAGPSIAALSPMCDAGSALKESLIALVLIPRLLGFQEALAICQLAFLPGVSGSPWEWEKKNGLKTGSCAGHGHHREYWRVGMGSIMEGFQTEAVVGGTQ